MPGQIGAYERDPGAILRQSFKIIEREADLARLPDDMVPVAARIIHACGMVDAVEDLAFSQGAGTRGRALVKAASDIVCDSAMVAAGLSFPDLAQAPTVHVAIREPQADAIARAEKTTRSAGGVIALRRFLDGALVVVGNAPTALFKVLEYYRDEGVRPALVLGFPVGFVGAAESKLALAESGLDFITLSGRRGGSAIAAAAVNALAREINAP